MLLSGVKNIFASRTQILRPKPFFCPSLATPGNITRNIVSATMFPSSARPLNAAFREKTSLIKTLAGKSDYRDPGKVCRDGTKKSRAKSGLVGDFFVPSRLTAPGSPSTREIESSCASSNIVSIEQYATQLNWKRKNSLRLIPRRLLIRKRKVLFFLHMIKHSLL